jgi:hypothetical protein
MSFYYQSGQGMNLLARAAAVKVPVAGGTLDTNFGLANLYDGMPSAYAKWAVAAADSPVDWDMNLLPNGDGEDSDFSAWTVFQDTGAATLAQLATDPYSGTNSIRIQLSGVANGAHSAGGRAIVRLRAGEKARLYHAGWIATGTNVKVYLQNLETGLWLTSAGAWSTSQAVATHTTAAWTDGYVTFTMPGVETGGGTWQRLQVTLEGNVAAGTAIDAKVEVVLVPGWDTIALFGHTFGPAMPLGFAYQALTGNNPGGSLAAETNVADWLKPTAATSDPIPADEWNQAAVVNKAQTTRYERWIRFYVTRTSVVPPTVQAGELILCQAETLERRPGLQVSGRRSATGQITLESGAGNPWVYNRTPLQRGKITLRWASESRSDMRYNALERAARYLFLERTQAGAFPVLVWPYSVDARAVYYGKPGNELGLEHDPPLRSWEVEVQDYPIPGLHHTLSPS